MARGSQEREIEFIATAEEKTGHSVAEWMTIIENSGVEPKTNTLIKHLKSAYGLNHLQASHLVGIYLNDGQPVYNYEVLFGKLFAGKNEKWLPLYQALEQMVQEQFDDVVCIPTKAYISIEGQKVFGCAKLTSKALRLGLDLGDMPMTGRVEKAKGLGAMPNISHMVELTSEADLDAEVQTLMQHAFDRVHIK